MNFARPSAIRGYFAALMLSILILATSAPLSADPATAGGLPTITISMDEGPNPPKWVWTPSANDFRPNGSGGLQLISPKEYDILSNRAHVTIQGLEFDPDPFVLNNILVTNTTTSTQIFSAFVGVPTTFPAPNLISGNVLPSVIDGGLGLALLSIRSRRPPRTGAPEHPLTPAAVKSICCGANDEIRNSNQ